MTEGERQIPQQLSADGNGTPLYDPARCSTNVESTSAGTPGGAGGGNGYIWEMGCTSPTSAAAHAAASVPTSSTVVTHPTISAFTTNNASPSSGVPTVVNVEEPSSSGSRKDDTMQSTSSDTSSDTFYTPSASLQNLSGSRMAEKYRRITDRQDDQKQKERQCYEEEEEPVADSVAPSTTISVTVTETMDSPSREEEDIGGGGGGGGGVGEAGESLPGSPQETRVTSSEFRQQSTSKSKKVQQHRRQNSAGSQCSTSSNPENSQFKTADAHSSDSDASRNSPSASGIFDNCSSSGGVGGLDYMRDDPDRKSLQSDHSHSGEQLNTSVESVEFGGAGEVAELHGYGGHSPRISGGYSGIKGPSGSASPQGSQISSSGSKPRGKKKMWYQQIFSTSYKTRSGDFKKIFKDLPSKERLIVDYSCALQKDILLQGRMYVSQNYVSFYANIFGWETQTSISFKEIESITKEKTALIIPNAIGITTMTEKFFFSSFVTRDTTYVMLFKLWQSALLDDNLTKKELWRLVHTCYGEELGVTSEDESEDMFCPPLVATSTVSTLITTAAEVDGGKSISIDPEKICSSPGRAAPEITVDKCDDDFGQDEDDDDDEEPRIGSWNWCRLRGASPIINGLVCAGEIGPAIAVGLNIGSSIVTSNGIPIGTEQILMKDSSILPLPVSVLPMTADATDSSDTEAVLESDLHREISSLPIVLPVPSSSVEVLDTSVDELPIVPPVCPVDHSIGKEMLNTVIPCDIDQLFTLLFTTSKFYLDFQTSRKTFDMNQCEWQLKDESHKTRQLSFTVLTGQAIGPKTAQVTETQTLLPASRPGLLYAIQSESVNAGIPYADAFSVNCHYCLTKISPNESNITVISKIHYKKSVWAKSFIEKNSMAALADYFSHLERALKEECANAKSNAGSVIPTSPVVISSLPRRRHPRKKGRAPDIPATALTRPNTETSSFHSVGTLRSSISAGMPDSLSESSAADVREGSLIMKIILTVLGCLLLLNGFLYFKLSSLETAANLSVLYPPAVQFSGEAPQTHEEWLMLLQQQETLHRSEVQGWHEILVSAIKILHQAEKDLENLKSHISTYGSGSVIVKPISRSPGDLFHSSGKPEKLDTVSPEAMTTDKAGVSHTDSIRNVGDVNSSE